MYFYRIAMKSARLENDEAPLNHLSQEMQTSVYLRNRGHNAYVRGNPGYENLDIVVGNVHLLRQKDNLRLVE